MSNRMGLFANSIAGSESAPNGLLDGLVSYYKADTNGSFPDAHGSNNLTINGATYTSSGKIFGGYSYDGVNDYIYSATADVIPTGAKSISIWFKTSDTGVQYLCGNCRVNSLYNGTFLWTNSGKLYANVCNGTNIISLTGTTTISNGAWHNVVFTWDGTTTTNKAIMYLDGVVEITGTATTTSDPTGEDTFFIGAQPVNQNYPYDGIIDEIGVWNRVLSTTEISELYNNGFGLHYGFFTN